MVRRPVSSTSLSFVPRSLRVTWIIPTPERLTIEVIPQPKSAECSVCCTSSHRVHSLYQRVLHDLPSQGRPVTIQIAARRFHCLSSRCTRRTFAERLTDVACPFGRRTGRLRDLQQHLGLALGGEAGARLAARISVPTSPDTLLRLASAHHSTPEHRPLGERRVTPASTSAIGGGREASWCWSNDHPYLRRTRRRPQDRAWLAETRPGTILATAFWRQHPGPFQTLSWTPLE
jgi:transposase